MALAVKLSSPGPILFRQKRIGQDGREIEDTAQAVFQYADGTTRQLVCFSHSFDYYISNHTPADGEGWDQRRHTLTATLTRLAAALRAPNYQEPSGDSDS